MRVLIACEQSGVIREAFRRRGHEAVSCDLQDTAQPGPHIKGDALKILGEGWDLMVANVPCTYLATVGLNWLAKDPTRAAKVEEALIFALAFFNAPIPKICIENPISILSSRVRPADQTINPYQFGHREQKRTCLWLKGLPRLYPTHLIPKAQRVEFVLRQGEKKSRAMVRSRTFEGVAEAMAEQWGNPERFRLYA